jgi:hypothetical protein
MLKYISAFFILACSNQIKAQSKTDSLLKQLLFATNDSFITKVISHPDVYRLQIIYTQINRDANNHPSFHNYYLNYDPELYFNPASTVKLPLALLSLEKLNNLHQKGVNKYTTMKFDSSYNGEKELSIDTTARSGKPSIAHFIKRALLISENDPYNRMYQFVGQQTINRMLHAKGYKDVRITRQFMGFSAEQNRHTNGIHFLEDNGNEIYYQPPAYNTDSFDFSRTIKIGKAHWDRNDSLVQGPFDFTEHNNISLLDLQQILQSVLFPASVPKQQRFSLSDDDYHFMFRYLSQFPSETPDPKYDSTIFYNSYVKFFFRDSTHQIPPNVRVFNKVGWAYGFLTDVSYVADFEHKTEFMLSATMYVNSDEVVNDSQYDYDNIGHPFLYHLGQTIYRYELNRKRKYLPDLSKFKINYEHWDMNDKRQPLREVDN